MSSLPEMRETEDVMKQEELVATINEETFLDDAALKILSCIATFSSEAGHELLDVEPEMKRSYDAYNYPKSLRRRDSKDDIEHRKRGFLWTSKQSVVCRTALGEKAGQHAEALEPFKKACMGRRRDFGWLDLRYARSVSEWS
ncbi:hypothetical protein HDV57DRAFT_411221 [Trichoderma longibrachiatum]